MKQAVESSKNEQSFRRVASKVAFGDVSVLKSGWLTI
jgi:hypothetical protein